MAFNTNYLSTPIKNIPDEDNLRWDHSEPKQPHRGAFSKDRDRILYSKYFLRLRGKTQVFMLHKNDYIRTRMTHSLEVNQIAKTIASALGLNIELTEAIALGHDVGHTPFGHIGERTIAKMLNEDVDIPINEKGFKHNLQALRLLCELEKGADYPNHKGLNLTKYTLWGISHHSSIKEKIDEATGLPLLPIQTEHPIYDSYLQAIDSYWSFEGLIVALADEIAQRHHDIEDSLLYGIISRKDLLSQISLFRGEFSNAEKKCFDRLQNELDTLADPVFNSLFARLVVNLYVSSAIAQTKDNMKNLGQVYRISKREDFQNNKNNISTFDYKESVSLKPALKLLDNVFQNYLKSHVLFSYQAQAMDGKAEYIIRKLYLAFCKNPTQLPDTALCSYSGFAGLPLTRNDALEHLDDHKNLLHRCIADYIGGMTDQFAYDEFDRLYGTKVF